MTNLKKYVEDKNRILKLFGDELEMPVLNQHPDIREAKCDAVLDYLESDLSPENLHCDGEISGTAAKAKAKFLMAVKAELIELINA